MKGIVLAGGRGTRLYPLTSVVNKQLMPVYNKPLIYYSIANLMLCGIREILIISNPEDLPLFQRLLGSGSDWAIELSYIAQEEPRGLAEAFILGEEFIGEDQVCLALGDNIFYGQAFAQTLREASKFDHGAVIFAYQVSSPESYGIIEFDDSGKVLSIEEKPKKPKSNFAVPGIYFYDNKVIQFAKEVKPSSRGELEITSINNRYFEQGNLLAKVLRRGIAWLDTGSHDSLLDASNYVATLERRQGLMVACLEEIAFRMSYIPKEQLLALAEKHSTNKYGAYLRNVATAQPWDRE